MKSTEALSCFAYPSLPESSYLMFEMGNTRKKLIRIYGVTLADLHFRARPYGHGSTKIEPINKKAFWVQYVDYFVDDLVALIKNQELKKIIIKKLT